MVNHGESGRTVYHTELLLPKKNGKSSDSKSVVSQMTSDGNHSAKKNNKKRNDKAR